MTQSIVYKNCGTLASDVNKARPLKAKAAKFGLKAKAKD